MHKLKNYSHMAYASCCLTITALSDFIGDSFTSDQTAQMCRLSMSWGGQNAIRLMLHEVAMKPGIEPRTSRV
ncbi:hypothetical protein DPMN_005916, partial [Dreissena polymorpha]